MKPGTTRWKLHTKYAGFRELNIASAPGEYPFKIDWVLYWVAIGGIAFEAAVCFAVTFLLSPDGIQSSFFAYLEKPRIGT